MDKYNPYAVVTRLIVNEVPCYVLSKRAAIAAANVAQYLWGGGISCFTRYFSFNHIVFVGMGFPDDGRAFMLGYMEDVKGG